MGITLKTFSFDVLFMLITLKSALCGMSVLGNKNAVTI